MTPTLTFHGAAGCVTGFCAELRTADSRVLIDCGMFQGSKTLKALNYAPFPFDASKIDAVLLTHAHIDHSGLLPKLMLAGFRGPVFATAATRDLCAVMLADSAGIQESEVRFLNRRNQRRGRPAVEPIYRERDAEELMRQFRRVKQGDAVQVTPDIEVVYWNAGHILGASSVEVRCGLGEDRQVILFSGDLGQGGSEFVADPDGPAGVDHLIMESTYGNRERLNTDGVSRRAALAEELRAAHDAGGPLLIPAFAVERTQELLADILMVMDAGDAPRGDIFLDSPLAIEATDVFLRRGWNSTTGRNPFEMVRPNSQLRYLDRPRESDGLERLSGWHIILAASGMCDAGRVRNHLKRLLWREDVTVMLSGFQATGTLGRLLAEGAERVTIQGDEVRVKARIRMLDVYSAHADANGLVAWAKARGPVKGSVFLAHGEPDAVVGLKDRLTTAGFASGAILQPQLDDAFLLERGGALRTASGQPRLQPARAASLDWHNAKTRLLMDLNAALERAPDDAARERLIATVSQGLSGLEAA